MPLIFITNPELLILAVEVPLIELILHIVTAIVGALVVGLGTGGYIFTSINVGFRGLLVISGIALITANFLFTSIGLFVALLIISINYRGLFASDTAPLIQGKR